MDFNKVIIVGRIVKDAEVRSVGNSKVADTAVAVKRVFKKDDKLEEETTFVDLTLWAGLAERAEKYLKKGVEVLVEGRLTQERWESKDGEKRSKMKVTVESFSLGQKSKSSSGQQNQDDEDESPF